ncbi:hypothetical protein A2U01_0017511 [Trifolium medium]|uniref:Uncharacterized protein n=1 Tax=Trifolium medium TaxID=97028 RepID=A0A392ND96_9FABA|nr:hypothetical protein [Trifolium medium]
MLVGDAVLPLDGGVWRVMVATERWFREEYSTGSVKKVRKLS